MRKPDQAVCQANEILKIFECRSKMSENAKACFPPEGIQEERVKFCGGGGTRDLLLGTIKEVYCPLA